MSYQPSKPQEMSFKAFNKKYEFEQTHITNISSDYLTDSGSSWGLWHAFRESVQNMADEAEYMSDEHGGEILIIFNGNCSHIQPGPVPNMSTTNQIGYRALN